MKKIAGIACFLIAGCATQKTIHLPDGSTGYSINCDGSARSWNVCYEKAGQICGARGYDIVNQQDESTPMATSTQYGAMVGSMVTRSLLVKCK